MAIPCVIRQSLGDTTHSRPVRRSGQRPPVDIDASYDVCEQITPAEARNLYYAVEPLPAYRRRAVCPIYAFARRVDGAADGNLHRTHKLWLLAHARAGIPHDGTPRPVDPVLVALRDVSDPTAAARLADDLGVAMQLTNILCDLVEDSGRGRVYIPREDLARFGCPASPLSAPPERLSRVIRYEARRNREWYERGLSLLPLLDPPSAACIAAMAGIHKSILDRIERSPNDFLRARISLPGAEEARITATALTTREGSHVRRNPFTTTSF
jgi:phytoene synthase